MAYFTDNFNGLDYFPNIKFHHLEFYVGNAKQAREYYKKVFGFSDYAYSGPETGVRDKVSYVIKKNKVIYVLDFDIAKLKALILAKELGWEVKDVI